ncbi:hypothetical protein [Bifidobacterium choloepi]|uniref:Colicin transporter n=1 Tax=Bifidobacterium choloepi TaxID=2614131 RepID=A0A6I5NH26_9BIFI|nr:hypothetical protein [Bifidobacterium choloepi]NEG70544.1 hypothetical protein [Bifidobacterium choloepi]
MAGEKEQGERKRWWTQRRLAIAGAAVAVVLVMSWGIYEASDNSDQVAEAKSTCLEAADAARVAANQYNSLYVGDATTAAQIGSDDVSDPAVLTALSDAMDAETPANVVCKADSTSGYESETSQLNENTDWYNTHYASLKKAVDAVMDAKK